MGKLQINGDLLLAAGDEDRFLTFNYTGGTGYDWRIGYLGSGSGNENFLVFQSDKEGSTFYNALKFGLTTLNAEFGGTVTASSFIGSLSGNASTATKLATARTISLTGSVTGSGSFDGSGNLSISTTTNHTHSYLPLSGGNLTGHLYLTKAVGNSSTANTSQIIFGTSSNNHLALSSNTHALVLNPSTGSTTNQIILSLDSVSTFPNGVNYAQSAGNADSVDGWHSGSFMKVTGPVSSPNIVYDTVASMIQGASGSPSGSQYGAFLTLPYRKTFDNTQPDFAGQIFIPNGDDSTTPDGLYYRTSMSTSWRNWKSVIHSCSATYFGRTLPTSGMNTGDVFFKT